MRQNSYHLGAQAGSVRVWVRAVSSLPEGTWLSTVLGLLFNVTFCSDKNGLFLDHSILYFIGLCSF